MPEYYRKKEDENGNIIFELVKDGDITILGKSLIEVIDILNALDIERITNIKMTMENLKIYQELLEKEYYDSIKNVMSKIRLKEDETAQNIKINFKGAKINDK